MSDNKEPFDYPGEFNKLMELVRTAAMSDVDVDGLFEWHSRAGAFGPFVDPTLFINGGARRLEEQGTVLAFAIPFVRKSRALLAAEMERLAGGGAPR